MGSATTELEQPKGNDVATKKTLKHFIQSIFHKDPRKKGKDKPKLEQEIDDTDHIKPITATPVADLLQNLEKLDIRKESEEEREDFDSVEDEIKNNFTVKTVDVTECGRIERYTSNSSEDSGYSDRYGKGDGSKEDLTDKLSNLKIVEKEAKDDGKKKERRLQTVFVPRAPIKTSVVKVNTRHPYQQINQVNTQTFSGGQVIVNAQNVPSTQTISQFDDIEINLALSQVDAEVYSFNQKTREEQDMFLETATELVIEDGRMLSDILDELLDKEDCGSSDEKMNPIDYFMPPWSSVSGLVDAKDVDGFSTSTLLTPPRSNEAQSSPVHIQSPSLYDPSYIQNSPHTDYTFSPETLSPHLLDDHEICQEFDESIFPQSVVEPPKEIKPKDKVRRSSSISMKCIKDMQRELQAQFSRQPCCMRARSPPARVFEEHSQKLSFVQRKNLCLRIAGMNMKTSYGVLHHILMGLSSPTCEQDSIHYTIFYLILQQVLAQKPALFLTEFGLNLLKAAALRCPQRPELTRWLVRCVRAALPAHAPGDGPLFTETDSLGEGVAGACARAGDGGARALAELLARAPGERALFHVDHANADGFTPLHEACRLHAPGRASLHTVHVLLAHGRADPYRGDSKGGDTALHLAVNSATCDLKLVQTLFLHIDRKQWKQYAHAPNRSYKTPLEYARDASKQPTRQNYPQEVLDMLKKCR